MPQHNEKPQQENDPPVFILSKGMLSVLSDFVLLKAVLKKRRKMLAKKKAREAAKLAVQNRLARAEAWKIAKAFKLQQEIRNRPVRTLGDPIRSPAIETKISPGVSDRGKE